MQQEWNTADDRTITLANSNGGNVKSSTIIILDFALDLPSDSITVIPVASFGFVGNRTRAQFQQV